MMPLRDYQERAVSEAVQALEEHGSALYVCPTGGGKTFVLAELAKRLRPKGRLLILSDREHLIHQTASVIKDRSGLTVGVEQGILCVNRRRLPDVTCATIQSMRRVSRLHAFKRTSFKTILIDEADLSVAQSYQVVLDYFVGAKVFGCTATPDRSDRKSLSPTFKIALSEVIMPDLIDRGFLVPLRRKLVRIESIDLSLIRSRGGDFADIDIQKAFEDEKALHEVVKPAIELAKSRPTLVFSATVLHAERLANIFNRYLPGKAMAIHGKMSTNERSNIISRFTSGELQYLCSCALLLRGIDLPFVSCVVMARPTKSRAIYCQSMGRGTRICTGKRDLLVLDYTDNSLCHDIMCVVDALSPESKEVRLRARQLLDANPGEGDPCNALDIARTELATDPELLAHIRAEVKYHTTSINGRKRPDIDWHSQPLGKMPDKSLADRLGVSEPAVAHQRRLRKIQAYGQCNPIDWDSCAHLLGVLPDYDLALNHLHIGPQRVKKERERRGIPSARADIKPKTMASSIPWDEVDFGYSDRCIGRLYGIHATAVKAERGRRGILHVRVRSKAWWDRQPLGTMRDKDLAEALRMKPADISHQRRIRNIPPFSPGAITKQMLDYKEVVDPRPICRAPVNWDEQPLGKIPDPTLAKHLGVSVSSTVNARTRRGIPAATKKTV